MSSHEEPGVIIAILLGAALFVMVFIALSPYFDSNTRPDPYAGCELIAKEKTGRSRGNVATKFVTRQFEWVKTWQCPTGKKLQVVWG